MSTAQRQRQRLAGRTDGRRKRASPRSPLRKRARRSWEGHLSPPQRARSRDAKARPNNGPAKSRLDGVRTADALQNVPAAATPQTGRRPSPPPSHWPQDGASKPVSSLDWARA